MSMDRRLPAFYDELEKIAISVRDSSFMQTRTGRRPIRVHNLLKKETAHKVSKMPEDRPDVGVSGNNAASYESEAGAGLRDGA